MSDLSDALLGVTRTYYFEQGRSNKWNLYLRMPGETHDKFIGVVFDSYVASMVVGWLNYWVGVEHLDDDVLRDITFDMPEAERTAA